MPMTGDASSEIVALLRGVNVGSSTRITMLQLREALTTIGAINIKTIGASGNIVLKLPATEDSKLIAEAISSALWENLELKIPCITLTRTELHRVLTHNPFAQRVTDAKLMQVVFLSKVPNIDTAGDEPSLLDPENIHRYGRWIYQWCPAGIRNAPNTLKFIESRLKLHGTARNWSALTRINDSFY